MTTLAPGLRLHDRFLLVERIGVGGMAEVWRADDAVLGRTVAVKVLNPSLGSANTIRMATHREARAAARLSHPNITRVYDYGEAALPDGRLAPYLVMELVDGPSLADLLRGGALPWREAARIAGQAAAGLAAAHEIGVVHCDVKPANIMLTPGGAKILDFGVAGLAGHPDPSLVYGTVGYIAPERVAGASPAPPSDVYSLGVLLAEALVGRRPESTGGVAEFPLLPGVPEDLVRLGTTCLAADPHGRPAAAEVSRTLGLLAGDPAPSMIKASHQREQGRGGHGTAARAGAAAAGAGAVGGGAVGGGAFVRPAAGAGAAGTGAAGGFAAGSASVARAGSGGRAAVPAPTSVVRGGVDDDDYPVAGRSGRSPFRVVAIASAAAVLVFVTMIVVALTSNPDSGGQDGVTQSVATPPEETPTPEETTPPPGSLQASLAALEAFEKALDAAVATGAVDADAAERVGKGLEELREAVEEDHDVSKKADDLRRDLRRNRNDEHIDEFVRIQLLRLLTPFTEQSNERGNGDEG